MTNALIDTGSTISLLNWQIIPLSMHSSIEPTPASVRSVTASPLTIVGTLSASMKINDMKFPGQRFIIAKNISFDAILGTDFLSQHSASIVFENDTWHVALPGKIACAISNSVDARVKLSATVTVPPLHKVTLAATCEDDISGVTCLIEGLPSFIEKHPELDVGSIISNMSQHELIIPVVNRSDQPVTLYAGTNIAEAVDIPKEQVCSSEMCNAVGSDVAAGKEDELRSYVERQDHLSVQNKEKLLLLLLDYQDVFLTTDDTLGYCTVYPHTINTGNAPPIKQAARRLPFHRREELQSLLDDMLQQGIITESNSPWAAPVVLVKKKDGSTRLCVDYRKLNSVTVQDAYPLPRVDDTLDSLHGCNLFSTMDLASGYWQLAMSESDREKSAFSTPMGLYEFTVLPMGVCNGPATFQRAMEKILGDLLLTVTAPICRGFFDDINVASSGPDGHFIMLEKVFARLRQANLKLKLKKCHFLHPEVDFLGYRVSEAGVSTCPKKVEKVRDWPTPTTPTEVKSFLGLASYYRKFVKNFSKVAAPLHVLTTKNAKFVWTKPCAIAFRILKERLTSAPVLAYPDFSADASPFVLDTDASNCGMGAVLSQQQDGESRVIAYASKVFNKSQCNYHAYDRELLACVTFIEQFRHFLVAKAFKLRTDHEALKSLFHSLDPRGRRARWIEKLSDYDFEIIHRAGNKHGNADALSRRPPEADTLSTTSSLPTVSVAAVTPAITVLPDIQCLSQEDLRVAQRNDADLALVLSWYDDTTGSLVRPSEEALVGTSAKIRRYAAEISLFAIHDGILWYDGAAEGDDVLMFVVPESLKSIAVSSVHDLPGGGHLGGDKTVAKCKQRFFWYGMSTFVKTYIQACLVCEQSSSKTSHGIASLGSLAAGFRFERVCLDIVGPLPVSDRGHKYILVAIDCFSRWAQAFPLTNMTAESVAEAFVLGWVALFGAPHSVHTDQGTQFTSALFKEVCRLLSISKSQTTSYHPEGNGQVERVNRTIVQLLRVHVRGNERDWDKALPLVMMTYRTALHRSTGFTPVKMVLGTELRLPADLVFGLPEQDVRKSPSRYVLSLEDTLRECFQTARQTDSSNHVVQRDYHDRKASGAAFAEDDYVWLLDTVIPYGSGEKKFKWPWQGPFIVTRCRHPVYDIRSLSDAASVKRVNFNRLKACKSHVPLPHPSPSQPQHEPLISLDDPMPAFEWTDDDLPLQPPPAPPPPPAPNPRAHLQRQAGLPPRLNQFVVPPRGHR